MVGSLAAWCEPQLAPWRLKSGPGVESWRGGLFFFELLIIDIFMDLDDLWISFDLFTDIRYTKIYGYL